MCGGKALAVLQNRRKAARQMYKTVDVWLRLWRVFLCVPQGRAVSWTVWTHSHRSWMSRIMCRNQTVRLWNRWIVTLVQLLHFLNFADVRDMKLWDVMFKLRLLFVVARWSLCSGSAGQSVFFCWKHDRLQSWSFSADCFTVTCLVSCYRYTAEASNIHVSTQADNILYFCTWLSALLLHCYQKKSRTVSSRASQTRRLCLCICGGSTTSEFIQS